MSPDVTLAGGRRSGQRKARSTCHGQAVETLPGLGSLGRTGVKGGSPTGKREEPLTDARDQHGLYE